MALYNCRIDLASNHCFIIFVDFGLFEADEVVEAGGLVDGVDEAKDGEGFVHSDDAGSGDEVVGAVFGDLFLEGFEDRFGDLWFVSFS